MLRERRFGPTCLADLGHCLPIPAKLVQHLTKLVQPWPTWPKFGPKRANIWPKLLDTGGCVWPASLHRRPHADSGRDLPLERARARLFAASRCVPPHTPRILRGRPFETSISSVLERDLARAARILGRVRRLCVGRRGLVAARGPFFKKPLRRTLLSEHSFARPTRATRSTLGACARFAPPSPRKFVQRSCAPRPRHREHARRGPHRHSFVELRRASWRVSEEAAAAGGVSLGL